MGIYEDENGQQSGGAVRMIRKIWIINMMLALAVVLIFSAAYRSWNRSGLTITEMPVKTTGNAANAARLDQRNISRGSYGIIEKTNLFSPERAPAVRTVNLETRKVDAVSEDTTPAFIKQKYTLYGVILKKDDMRALIKAPVKEEKTNPTRWVSVGDQLDNFKVSEILHDKVFIENNVERYVISLYKQKEPLVAAAQAVNQDSEREAPRIISTQVSDGSDTEKEIETDGTVVIDGNYKIIETPFGKSRIRIK